MSTGNTPVQITLRGMAHSDALADLIRSKADGLAQVHERIASCRVTLEVIGRHKEHGSEVEVHVDLKVPGEEIAVTRKRAEHAEVAVREAFDAAKRTLEEHARRQREARRAGA